MPSTAPFDASTAAETTFLPLADPARRAADPLRALAAAHDLRILLALAELGAVRQARTIGASWTAIGDALGMSRQAAHERFALLLHEPADAQPPQRRNRPGPGSGSRQQPKKRRK